MSNLGSGDHGEFTFIDMLALLSFFVGVANLDMNVTQEDKQELQSDLSNQTNVLLDEIHGHLAKQDQKIDMLIRLLEEQADGSHKET